MLEQMILVTTFFLFPLVFSDRVPSTPLSVSAFCSARVAAPPYLVQCGSFNLHAPLFAARSQRLFMDVARERVFRVRFEHKRLKTSQPLPLPPSSLSLSLSQFTGNVSILLFVSNSLERGTN